MSRLTFAQMEGSRYCFGRSGHPFSRCPEQGKQKSEGTDNEVWCMLSKS